MKPNPAFAWKEVSRQGDLVELRLTSQVWQGQKWTHDLVVCYPLGVRGLDRALPKGAILYVTGDRVDSADLPLMRNIAKQARMPVIGVFDIPNQPLFEASEDALIAVTFGKFLETGDASWPLLFPMTKSATAAMDAVGQWSKGKINEFVVFGASKRGWTTWFTGVAGDKRVKAIAPAVFDNLNFNLQMPHQLKSWGKYSEMIADYVDSGLIEALKTERGQQLGRMMDPFYYLSDLKVPVLTILGSNDRYWAVDAHRLYWNAIKTPKWLSIVPNAGHSISDPQVASTLAFFARSIFSSLKGGLPKISTFNAKSGDRRQVGHQDWICNSDTLDFRDEVWQRSPVLELNSNRATFTSVILESEGVRGTFSSPVRVTKR